MTVGENIRRIRKEKRLTQKQLGELCKMYESQIRQYELGILNPKLETLHKIATALGVNMTDLLSDFALSSFEISKEISAKEQYLIDKFRLLTIQGQDEAVKRVEELTEIKKYTE